MSRLTRRMTLRKSNENAALRKASYRGYDASVRPDCCKDAALTWDSALSFFDGPGVSRRSRGLWPPWSLWRCYGTKFVHVALSPR